MEVPKLRQPKIMMQKENQEMRKAKSGVPAKNKKIPTDQSQVMVSLKNDSTKLVVSSDAYNAILMAGDMHKCLICEVSLNVYDAKGKDAHKESKKHAAAIQKYPHLNEYGENLIRKIKDNFYCTMCNVVVSHNSLSRHINTETHKEELKRAINKGAFYKPKV